MTVTKRARFEVLKRDGYTCRYCHSTENPLTIDHVVPEALGGTDDPANLVAACRDCNSGKSSVPPDAELVEAVRDDARRYAERLRQAFAVLAERLGERNEYIDQFEEVYTYSPVPKDWRSTVGRWFDMGVPVDIIVDAANLACSKPQQFAGTARFSYFCGIVWNQVRDVIAAVDRHDHLDGRFLTRDEARDLYEDGEEHTWRHPAIQRALSQASLWSMVCSVADGPTPQVARMVELHTTRSPRWMEKVEAAWRSSLTGAAA